MEDGRVDNQTKGDWSAGVVGSKAISKEPVGGRALDDQWGEEDPEESDQEEKNISLDGQLN